MAKEARDRATESRANRPEMDRLRMMLGEKDFAHQVGIVVFAPFGD